ncbi:unnamed protein product [Cuscuta epithymum]|uniref:Uncharacterized protein n=1 Tax=Cuscuta epithymum TaxID=186058 RepID=A0AAV0FNC5_9ASTE|nr:unnamed protein product [Cuscuta epithymum]
MNTPNTLCYRSPHAMQQPAAESSSYSCFAELTNNYNVSISTPSCIPSDDETNNYLKEKLRELENVMLGPEEDPDPDPEIDPPETVSWTQMMEAITGGDIKQVLIACAKAVSVNDWSTAGCLMGELRKMVSVTGDSIQRVGAYMLEGLVARLAASGSSIYTAMRFRDPGFFDTVMFNHILFEVCPYFKFGHMSANGSIADAMKGEAQVHIIDFQIGQGNQWVSLIQAFARRPGGPPHIRMTGIDGISSSADDGVGVKLSHLAASCKVPFDFHHAYMYENEVHLENLRIHPGEALAVNFGFILHRVPDESVSTQNHRDRLLRQVRSLNPKVVTLVEQESNTNTAPFLPRFLETLDYYTAVFESIDAVLQRDHKNRILVEQHCLAKGVVNVVSCEGTDRVERHEVMGKWKSRFLMAGFQPYPLNPQVNRTIKELLGNYSNQYRLEVRNDTLYLGWKDRDLVASCAWK